MKRAELALLAASVLGTLLAALALIRWLAPGLLGGPKDLRLVRSAERIAAFYEGIFRAEDFSTAEFLLKDPRTLNRPRPFHGEGASPPLGPHDVLGFRNRAVPAVADVVVIGDSQTYGNNAMLEDSWPSVMSRALDGAIVYGMATGGWGAVQYLDMVHNAGAFRPRAVVVALYTGNDALDSFQLAYGSETWRALRPDPSVSIADAPIGVFPPPQAEWWPAAFADGAIVFTPTARRVGNRDHVAVNAGYGVIRKALVLMAQAAVQADFQLFVAIIPTKELVYSQRVAGAGLEAPEDYRALVAYEAARIEELVQHVRDLPQTTYVDLVGPLQRAASQRGLYPEEWDGHPLEGGYRVIGDAVAAAVKPALPAAPRGWVMVPAGGDEAAIYLLRGGTAWLFPSPALVRAAGWSAIDPSPVTPRALANFPKRTVGPGDLRQLGPER